MRDGFHRLTRPTKLLTFEPHLHSSGKRMCFEALYPNNAREILSCADSAISRMVYLTEEQFEEELTARGGTPVFATSQDNQQ